MSTTIENLNAYQADVTARAAEFERAKAGQLTFDGKPIAPPDQHAANMARILAPLEASVQDAYDVAERATAEADAQLSVQWADPTASVPTDELIRLQALAPWIEQEVAALAGEPLRQRLVWALHHGDNATRRLYMREAVKYKTESWYSFIFPVVQAIAEALTPAKDRNKVTKQLEQAQALKQRALDLKMFASDTLGQANGSRAAAEAKRRQEYGGRL